MQELVSVIVPVYKVEKYLDRCILSLVNQTYTIIEIILINDGSPDTCPLICNEWAKKDNRIRVINKENSGLGYARNTGIENAKGKYICFVDSDDYIDKWTIEKSLEYIISTRTEIVCFGYYTDGYDSKIKSMNVPRMPKSIYRGIDVQDIFLPELMSTDIATGFTSKLMMSSCMALFSMELIQRSQWRFVSEREIISEDSYSLLKLYRYVESVAILSESFYHYCENTSSLTHSFRMDRFMRIKQYYYECIRVCEESKYNSEVRKRLSYIIVAFCIAALKQIECADIHYEIKKKELYCIISDNLLQDILSLRIFGKLPITRYLLFLAIRHKQLSVCYILIKMQNRLKEVSK